ncbi:unnamed protein product [Paramecium primaurelia]|uniref:Uncharacterized protein n=1 Tax=Paramecium primaurelia TaxID=5886 RepID=A0A8S1LTX0_PARPR|nr:unnamed protein product [Paramecium primaurelia]
MINDTIIPKKQKIRELYFCLLIPIVTMATLIIQSRELIQSKWLQQMKWLLIYLSQVI